MADLAIDLGFQKLSAPSMADKVLDLPDVPVPVNKAFEGKPLLSAFLLSRSPSIGDSRELSGSYNRNSSRSAIGLREHMALYRFLVIVTVRHP